MKLSEKLKSWVYKNKSNENKFIPNQPYIWWIDDLTHRVCGLIDHPKVGLADIPWPDCDSVYLAIDKREYDKLVKENAELRRKLSNSGIYSGHSVSAGTSKIKVKLSR